MISTYVYDMIINCALGGECKYEESMKAAYITDYDLFLNEVDLSASL